MADPISRRFVLTHIESEPIDCEGLAVWPAEILESYRRYKDRSLHSSWVADQVAGLRRAYPDDQSATPRPVTNGPNSLASRQSTAVIVPNMQMRDRGHSWHEWPKMAWANIYA